MTGIIRLKIPHAGSGYESKICFFSSKKLRSKQLSPGGTARKKMNFSYRPTDLSITK